MPVKSTLEKRCRKVITESERVIIKVGTRVITDRTGTPELRYMRRLVHQIAHLHNQGREVILVSSGAVGAGMAALGITQRPTEVPDLQMCAAVGQAKLMSTYEMLFSRCGIRVGQVLLTHTDFTDKIRQMNAKRVLEHLIDRRVIPIINENDVVADEELKNMLSLGDNDYLSALVARLTHTHVLVLLSTVEGLLKEAKTRSVGTVGRKRRVSYVSNVEDAIKLINPNMISDGGLSKGGMESKLRATQMALEMGVPVVIAGGRRVSVLLRIFAGADEGTLFFPQI